MDLGEPAEASIRSSSNTSSSKQASSNTLNESRSRICRQSPAQPALMGWKSIAYR